MTDTTETLPFAVYEPRNLGSTRAYVYLGKNISDGIKVFESFAGDERTSDNCLTVLMFASIIGGKQMRIDTWTDKDPHTFVDQRFYDLRPFRYLKSWNKNYKPPVDTKLQDYIDSLEGVIDETMPYNRTIYERGQTYIDNFDPVYYIRKLTSDGSVVVNANGGRFWWGENAGENGDVVNNNPDNHLDLQAHEYDVKCENDDGICPIKEVKVDNKRNGLTYIMRNLKSGKDTALFEYDRWVNARDGLVFEDLSDLLPEGVHQIAQWKQCDAKWTQGMFEDCDYEISSSSSSSGDSSSSSSSSSSGDSSSSSSSSDGGDSSSSSSSSDGGDSSSSSSSGVGGPTCYKIVSWSYAKGDANCSHTVVVTYAKSGGGNGTSTINLPGGSGGGSQLIGDGECSVSPSYSIGGTSTPLACCTGIYARMSAPFTSTVQTWDIEDGCDNDYNDGIVTIYLEECPCP